MSLMSKIDVDNKKLKLLLNDDELDNQETTQNDKLNDEPDQNDNYDLETLEILFHALKEDLNQLEIPIGEHLNLNNIQKCILALMKKST